MNNVVFEEATHTYIVDGVELPSVTHICRFLHYDTAVNAKPWLRDVAADRGTRIHAYTAMLDYGEPLGDEDIDMDCLGYVKAYRRFLEDYKPQWDGIETVLGSTKLGYAGTVDRYGKIGKDSVVLDIKTGSSVNRIAVNSQLWGYENLLEEKSFEADLSFVLLLRKDGTYVLKDLTAEHAFFDYCLEMHQTLSQKGMRIR